MSLVLVALPCLAQEELEDAPLEADESGSAEPETLEWGWSLDEVEEEAALFAPELGPEYQGDIVEPGPDAPSTLVVIGGADAIAERFAVDIERIVTARLERTGALAHHDPRPVLLAGQDGDPLREIEKAREYSKKAFDHYHMLELDESAESFELALESYARALPAGWTEREVAETFLRLGATHFVAGNRQSAQEAFRQAVILDPEHAPDPSLFSPPMIEAFEGARWEVMAHPAGPLTISATPPHSEVWVNGVFRGITPITIDGLPLGTVFVMARHRGFIPRVETPSTAVGETVRIDVSLRSGPSAGIYGSYKDAAVADMRSQGQAMPRSVARLAEMFLVDRVIVGRVTSDGQGRQALLRTFDVSSELLVTEGLLDLLSFSPDDLVKEVDAFLLESAKAPPQPIPEAVVASLAREVKIPVFMDDWRFWATTSAVLAVAGGVALTVAISSGSDPAEPHPPSSWPVIRIPP